MNAILRLANKNDSTSLAKLAEHTFRETYRSENLSANIDLHCLQNFSSEIQQQEIINPDIVTLLAEVENNLVGYAQLRFGSSLDCINASRPVELFRIYVSKTLQGTGLAQQIIKGAQSVASNENSNCIWLGVWEQNPRAIRFYRKQGFSQVGEHVFKLGLEPQRDLIMTANVVCK